MSTSKSARAGAATGRFIGATGAVLWKGLEATAIGSGEFLSSAATGAEAGFTDRCDAIDEKRAAAKAARTLAIASQPIVPTLPKAKAVKAMTV